MKFEGLLLCLFLGPVLPLDPSKERSLQELGEGEGESGNKSVHFRSQGLKVQGSFVPDTQFCGIRPPKFNNSSNY